MSIILAAVAEESRRDAPRERGLYLCKLSEPLDQRILPRHPFMLLFWSGQGSEIDMPERWGDPISCREISASLITEWVGPIHLVEHGKRLVRRSAAFLEERPRRQARLL